jgi:hypothetical protein
MLKRVVISPLGLAIVTALLISPAATADREIILSCTPTPLPTAEPDRNPVVNSDVRARFQNGDWEMSVIHHLYDGSVTVRAEQYGDIIIRQGKMNSARLKDIWWVGWTGAHKRAPDVFMTGVLKMAGNIWVYEENIYRHSNPKYEQPTMRALCKTPGAENF